jgi:hypothetical protein
MRTPGQLAVAALISGERADTLTVSGFKLGDASEEPNGHVRRQDDISFQVEGGRINRIYLARKCFSEVQWRTPEDVIADLGAPDVIERGNRNSRLTFPTLSLVVFLDHEAHEVQATIMSVPVVGPRRFTVRDLLAELIRAPWLTTAETPDHRTARAHRTRGELLATEFGLDLRTLASGDFLDARDGPNPEFHALLRRHAGERGDRLACNERHAFLHLLTFRQSASRVVQHNSGFMEAGGEYAGLLHMTYTRGLLDPILEEVDQALCMLLDPESRTIEEARLLERGWITDTVLREWEIDDY